MCNSKWNHISTIRPTTTTTATEKMKYTMNPEEEMTREKEQKNKYALY